MWRGPMKKRSKFQLQGLLYNIIYSIRAYITTSKGGVGTGVGLPRFRIYVFTFNNLINNLSIRFNATTYLFQFMFLKDFSGNFIMLNSYTF